MIFKGGRGSRLVGGLSLAIVLACGGVAHAQDEGGVLRMSEGASLWAEADDAFHEIGELGLTIEGWFYLDELPDVGEVLTFFTNPGKYTAGVGIARFADGDEWYDPGEARAMGSFWTEQRWGSNFSLIMGRGVDRNPPVRRWFHVALQFHAEPPSVGWIYMAENAMDLRSAAEFPFELETGPGSFRLASPGTEVGHFGFDVEAGTRISGFRGLVDEVRVSNIARYVGRDAVRPRRLRLDRHTVALWRFDGRRPFADSSPNGHDLIDDGQLAIEPLAVEARGKLATTWAQLRRGVR